jgi:hypothetical protein
MGNTVRFSALVKASGQPSVYLPLVAPCEDKEFMRAVKEQRVLTIHQEPTSKRRDAGTVGFVEEKFVTYFVFPKSLKDFDGARVVGIKYDVLEAVSVSTAKPKATAKGAEPVRRPPAVAPRAPIRENSPAPSSAPKPTKPGPQPSTWDVTVRLTATYEVVVPVTSFTKSEASAQALARARSEADFGKADVAARAVKTVKQR